MGIGHVYATWVGKGKPTKGFLWHSVCIELIGQNKPNIDYITSENFESYKNGELPLVVDLWATWCGPCKMLGPIISELANDYDGKIVVGKCDVEENNEVAAEFGVRSVPTILFFKGGQLVDKFVGATNKETLDAKFQALL